MPCSNASGRVRIGRARTQWRRGLREGASRAMDFIFFITALLLILCGVLAAAPLIVSKAPDSQKMIDNLRPLQGGMGLVVCLWGIYIVIRMLINIEALRV